MNVGTRIGPYEITGMIGAGGMGAVYRARDSRLGRDVAIKVLPGDVAADPERLERFEREARATASLSHPNVLHVYDVGTHDGAPYIVEELVAGKSLRQRLQGGPLPVRQAVELATQVARGLAAAHERHVVHRDLKPENVIVTPDGVAKILDFGLAKLVGPGAGGAADTLTHAPAGATETGRVLGTVAYMAPEQARGQAIDHRTDIFAFGVTLHEMLSGSRPFSGDTATDTIAAIIKEDPPPLPALVPDALLAIVRHCLEKRPEDRFQSARDLAFNLQALAAPAGRECPTAIPHAPTSGRRSALLAAAGLLTVVAVTALLITSLRPRRPAPLPSAGQRIKILVLPFENLGGPEDVYFTDGISEEIMSRLGTVRSLGVISRTTAIHYKATNKTVAQIGQELGVAYVLEGSVRWDKSGGAPGRVRISPQLIRVADDTHLWAERYDRVLADVFAIQSEVADGIVRALGLALAPEEQAGLRRMPTSNLEAYDLYLRVIQVRRNARARADFDEWIASAQAAVDRDPGFAEAYALLAQGRLRAYWFHFDRSPSLVEQARVEAERAFALQPAAAEAHLALGFWHYWGSLDYDAALVEFEKALTLEPSNATARAASGFIERRKGRVREAAQTLRQALELDPRSIDLWINFGETLTLGREYGNAVDAFMRAGALDPWVGEEVARRARALLLWRGDLGEARRLFPDSLARPNVRDDTGTIFLFAVRTALIARDFDGAERRLAAEGREAVDFQSWLVPRAQLRGELLLLQGRREESKAEFAAALELAEARLRADPGDSRVHSAAGIALAGLGRRDEAIREAEEGVRLMPPARDAFRGPSRVEDLAQVCSMVGDHEKAIDRLEWLLSNPSWVSVKLLEIEPRWDPLREDPRFQALLAKYRPPS